MAKKKKEDTAQPVTDRGIDDITGEPRQAWQDGEAEDCEADESEPADAAQPE